jgi:exonuclease VII large subunit
MIKSIHDVNENDDIDIQMNDGIVKAKVGDTIGK